MEFFRKYNKPFMIIVGVIFLATSFIGLGNMFIGP